MVRRLRKDLRLLAYPYLFVLKEGKGIKTDPMDFSLMMLQVASPEVIKSPNLVYVKDWQTKIPTAKNHLNTPC